MSSTSRSTPAARLRGPIVVLALAGLVGGAVIWLGIAAVRLAERAGDFLFWWGVVTGGLLVVAAVVGRRARRIPRRTVLELDLLELPSDRGAGDPLRRLRRRGLTLREVVETLERAGSDRRVAGLVAHIGFSRGGLATVQELRDAVAVFRAQGKFAIARADTFGEAGSALAAYHLATAFDEIDLHPSGDVWVTGVLLEAHFFRGALDKAGAVPQLDHRHEHKTAMNVLTETALTPAHRESLETIAGSIMSQLVSATAKSRELEESEVRELFDRGPFLATEALEARLVDHLAYRDETLARAKERAGDGRVLSLERYRKLRGRPRGGRTVALIHGRGAIRRGRSRFDPVTGREVMGSETVAAAFRRATEDRRVKAILFRVDSPGGSYVGSDAIWREVRRAREAGKPVVVSMGDVAGSGGYFVALGADRIVAQPGTITGSIGVVGGKVVVGGTKAKLGISVDEVHLGAHATMPSASYEFTPGEWERVQAGLDRIYEDFTGKVIEARGLAPERLSQVAGGRIWTGEQAREVGLVDDLGGYRVAFRLIRELAGLKPDARLSVKEFPRRSALAGLRRGDDEVESFVPALDDVLGPFTDLARAAMAARPDGVLRMPDLTLL